MSLDIYGLRDLIIKGFGLYLLVRVIQSVPMMIVTVLQSQLKADFADMAVTFAVTVVYAGLGYICVFRTHALMQVIWNDAEPVIVGATASALAKLIAVLGIYFGIQSAGLVCSFVWEVREPDVYIIGSLASSLAWFAIALWFIRCPEQVTEFIRRRESASG